MPISAISFVHERVDGYEVGQHPLVTKLIKGVFHEGPPKPCYTHHNLGCGNCTTYLDTLQLDDYGKLHLNDLTQKTAMLMALMPHLGMLT